MEEVSVYIDKQTKYKSVLEKLRSVLQETELEETLKWGMPVYCLNNKNVVGITAFKHKAGLWFYQGSFLKDEQQVLINAQEGKTKGMRHWYVENEDKMDLPLIKAYIEEAIENERKGLRIKIERKKIPMPEVLAEALTVDAALRSAFERMSKGNQNDFCRYINEAKQEATKLRRLDKIVPMILDGIGLNDKYRK